MAIKIISWIKCGEYRSAVIAMALRDKAAKLLDEDGLVALLNGADAEATQSFIEDFFCGENPGDSDDGNQ